MKVGQKLLEQLIIVKKLEFVGRGVLVTDVSARNVLVVSVQEGPHEHNRVRLVSLCQVYQVLKSIVRQAVSCRERAHTDHHLQGFSLLHLSALLQEVKLV